MDQFKSPASRLARLFHASRNAWKAKALDKQRRLRAAQVRIRDLEKSRAYWKARAQASPEPSPPSATPPSEERSEAPGSETEAPSSHLAAKIPAGKTWLASSDSIESMFGSYKRLAERGPLKEMGKLVLILPVMLTKLSTSMIREALERVHTQDVDQWARRALLRNNHSRIATRKVNHLRTRSLVKSHGGNSAHRIPPHCALPC